MWSSQNESLRARTANMVSECVVRTRDDFGQTVETSIKQVRYGKGSLRHVIDRLSDGIRAFADRMLHDQSVFSVSVWVKPDDVETSRAPFRELFENQSHTLALVLVRILGVTPLIDLKQYPAKRLLDQKIYPRIPFPGSSLLEGYRVFTDVANRKRIEE